eukprot:CFRG2654T1
MYREVQDIESSAEISKSVLRDKIEALTSELTESKSSHQMEIAKYEQRIANIPRETRAHSHHIEASQNNNNSSAFYEEVCKRKIRQAALLHETETARLKAKITKLEKQIEQAQKVLNGQEYVTSARRMLIQLLYI